VQKEIIWEEIRKERWLIGHASEEVTYAAAAQSYKCIEFSWNKRYAVRGF